MLQIVKYALGEESADGDDFTASDINSDGEIDIFDVLGCVEIALSESNALGLSSARRYEELSANELKELISSLEQLGIDEEGMSRVRELLSGIRSEVELPKAFELSQNVPNPFNPSTTIRFSIPEERSLDVKLNVYNIRGVLVKTLVDDRRGAGVHVVQWDGRDNRGRPVASGVYFYRIQAGEFVKIRKMVLLK